MPPYSGWATRPASSARRGPRPADVLAHALPTTPVVRVDGVEYRHRMGAFTLAA
jgi:hypothetical protein